MLCAATSAQMLVPRTETDQSDLPPLQVKYQHVTVKVDDQIARTSIEQVFINNTKRDLEATYFFPLSEQASIYDFAYYVKGERITGEIREKEEARRTYERIVSRMKDPALLEQVGRNLFKARIFPVSPDEPMKVELQYSEILPYDKGRIRYTYPLAMSGATTELGDLTVLVDVSDQKRITKVQSLTYDVDVVEKGDNRRIASFEESSIVPERDFTLVYEVESEDFGVNFAAYRPDPDAPGYFMLIMCPQEMTDEADVVKKDVVFVFDRSGSMKGPKITQAKAAMKYCVESLSGGDRFAVLTFSSEATTFRDELVPANAATKTAAAEHIDGLSARGGTAINDALLQALGMFGDTDAQKTVIFCTDGLPTIGEEDTEVIARNVKDANTEDVHVFCFGVGDDVDDLLLLKLATENRGTEEHVKTGESIEVNVSQFYDKVNTPLLVDLKLDFGDISTELIHPRELPDVFKGTQLFVAGRYKEPGRTDVILKGDLNGEDQVFERTVRFPEEETDNGFVGRVWARKRVDHLVDLMRLDGENEEVKDEIIGLSKEWTIQTPYTSFLAIPKEVKEEMQIAETAPPATSPPVTTPAPVDAVRVGRSGLEGGGLGGGGFGSMRAGGPRGPAGPQGRAGPDRRSDRRLSDLQRADLEPPVAFHDDNSLIIQDQGFAPGPTGPAGPAGAAGPQGPGGNPDPHAVEAIARKLLTEFGPELGVLQDQIDDLSSDADTASRTDPTRLPPGATHPVPYDHWAYDAVQKLVDEGAIVGYPKTHEFKGDREMTRFEFAMAIGRLMEWDGSALVTRYSAAAWFAKLAEDKGLKLDLAADCPFSDIPAGHEQRPVVAALAALGIIKPGEPFDGDSPLTRREFARWATRYLNAMGVDTGGKDAMRVVVAEGILEGHADGSIRPDEAMKREHLMIALARLAER